MKDLCGFQGNHIDKMEVYFKFLHIILVTMYVEGKKNWKITKNVMFQYIASVKYKYGSMSLMELMQLRRYQR